MRATTRGGLVIIAFLCPLLARITVVSQTAAVSRLRSTEPVRLESATEGVLVLGTDSYANGLHKGFVVHKPLRKLHEYDNGIEEGIVLRFSDGTVIRDTAAYGDFSAFYLGIASFPIELAVLFKIFG